MSTNVNSLPTSTVRLIGSTQVITSVYSVVKELLENSFDAEATSVEIKLENYGLDRIELRDNGIGIKQCNIPLVAKRYHTSKITNFSDLESLVTYGFRGEALGSLCAVSSLSITSKTANEDVSHCVSFDQHGNVISTVPSHLGQGTTVCASHLFKNMPVRRQFYNTVKKKKEELKKIEDLLMCYGAIRPNIRLSLRHGKEVVWQKNTVSDVRSALLGILGRNVVSQLEQKKITCENPEVIIEAFLPSSSSDVQITSRSTGDRCFTAVNNRPVFLKDIDKCIRQHYCQHHRCESRHPVYFLSINCPASQLDVNVEPNKTRVMLHHQKEIQAKLTNILEDLYGPVTKGSNADLEVKLNGTKESEDFSVPGGQHQQLDMYDRDQRFSPVLLDSESDKVVQHHIISNDNVNTHIDNSNKLNNQLVDDIQTNHDLKVSGPITDQSGSTTPPDNSLTGFRISFYDSNKNISNSTGVIHDDLTNLDQNENETTKSIENSSETININTNSNSISLTQVGKGCFDLVDDDLDNLLVSQKTDNIGSVESFEETGKNVDKSVNALSRTDNENKLILNENLPSKSLQVSDSVVWSKGQSETQTNGQKLEPVKLLVPGQEGSNKRPPSPTFDLELQAFTPLSKKMSSVQVDQPRIYDCVANNGSEKYSTGFVAFSKQIRPKVVEENPSASYDTITRLVQEKWARLSDTNKQHFCMVGKEEIENLKKTVVEKKKLAQKVSKSTVQIKPSLPSIKDQLLANSKTKTPMKTVKVSFNLTKLRQVYSTGIRESQTQLTPDLHLIGPLKFYNGWVCCHGSKLQILNPHRVEETLLHRELLDKHNLPVTRLDNPLRLSESNVGGTDLYETLLTLFPSTPVAQTYSLSTDERLVANGIQVRRHFNEDGTAVLDLVGLSQAMPLYGLSDLTEILDLICHTNATNLSMSRPLKVINYLQSEAVRMVRQRPLQRSRDDMLDILDQMKTSLPDSLVHCLHNKPFLHDLFHMINMPSIST